MGDEGYHTPINEDATTTPTSNNTTSEVTRTAFLFGSNIAHSLAPLIHHTIWRHLKLPWHFSLLDSTDPSTCLLQLASLNCIGCSITMPNKLTLLPHIDNLTKEALTIGAINTILVQTDPNTGARRYTGTNTDAVGIRDALVDAHPSILSDFDGQSALVLGAGGAARAAIYALWKYFDARTIFVVNRLEGEVQSMLASLTAGGVTTELVHLKSVEDLTAATSDPGIVISTVPDEVPGSVEEKRAWAVVEALVRRRKEKAVLLDMAYKPKPMTALLRLGQQYEWETVTGVDVVGFVCMAQARLWCGKELPEAAVKEVKESLQHALR